MKFYIYESHMGGHYWSKKYHKDTYCDSCGDSDIPLGYVSNKKEAYRLIRKYDHGYYAKSYIKEFVNSIPFVGEGS